MPHPAHLVSSRRTIVEAVLAGLIGAIMAVPVFGPILSRLDSAWSGSDLMSTYVNSVAWGGFTYRVTDHFGFPLGMNLRYFPGIDVTENTFAWLVNSLAHTTFAGINLLIIVSFPLVAVLAYLTIRLTGLAGPLAIALAEAFTFIPFHLGRALGHTYLATLYSMVVGLALVLLIGSGRWQWMLARRRIPAIIVVGLMVVVVAWTGIYYVAFTLILGAAALAWRIAQRARWRAIAIDALPLVAVVVLSVGAFLPSILTLRGDPPLASLGSRLPYESVTYAGALAMALLPLPWSAIPGLAAYNAKVVTAIAAAPWGESTAATNYGTWVTSIALAVLVIGLIVRARRGTLTTDDVPAGGAPRAGLPLIVMLTVVTILFLVPWGLGYLVAGTLTAEIRGWNRLVGALLLLFVLGAAAVLHRTSLARRLWVAIPVGAVVLALVMADTVLPFRGIYVDSAYTAGQQTDAARAYGAATNAAIPQKCGVLQLPYMAYPENGPARDVPDYDHFYAALTNDAKDFSYGAVKYTDAGVWAAQLPQAPTDAQLALLRGAGFCAIDVDFRGYISEQAAPLFDDLTKRLGPPVASGLDDSWKLFRIPDGPSSPAASASDVQAFLHQPFLERDPDSTTTPDSRLTSWWWWTTAQSSTFTIKATSPQFPVTTVSGAIGAPPCGPLPVTVTLATGDQAVRAQIVARTEAPTPFTLTLPAAATTATLTVQAGAQGCEAGKAGLTLPPGMTDVYTRVADVTAR